MRKISLLPLSLFCIALAGGGSPAAQTLADAQRAAAPTFSKDIAPIVFANCVTSHRQGELAPFSLLTYDDVRQHARQIAEVTRTRAMPPWKPEHTDVTFAGERRLTDAQIQILQQWADRGTPEGNPSDMPRPPVFESTWHLGTPNLVVTMPEAIDVP